ISPEFFADFYPEKSLYTTIRELVENLLDSTESMSKLLVVEITIEETKKSIFNSMIGLIYLEHVVAELYDDYEMIRSMSGNQDGFYILCEKGWREEMVLGIGWTTTLLYRDREEKMLLLSLGIGVECLICLQACVSVYLLWGASCLTQKKVQNMVPKRSFTYIAKETSQKMQLALVLPVLWFVLCVLGF
ncbi:hypothetical protein HN873_048862, partial [Arachis hypogaea]